MRAQIGLLFPVTEDVIEEVTRLIELKNIDRSRIVIGILVGDTDISIKGCRDLLRHMPKFLYIQEKNFGK